MKRRSALIISGVLAGLAVAILAAGCTNEKKVFVERPFFTNPPTAAQGFLGYDDATTKLTVCGNCHIDHQTGWVDTKHATAWADLQASGHASGACANCHTVGPNGNATSDSVGYASTQDARYHDVQCESCHGPGLNHVTNPDVTQPVASIKVLSVSGGDTTLVGCAECHNGIHHPFVEEWAQSKHAFREPSPSTRAECISCHTAQGALQAWGVNTDYLEKNAPLTPLGSQEPIVCAVCHDPHSTRNSNIGQLRHPVDIPDENRNLCVQCHHKRGVPEVTAATVRGPHSPEGPLLFGEAGWWPPNFNPQNDKIVASHGTGANPKLCATCHVNNFDVTDKTTGAFVIHVTGHLFEAIPCLDSQGKPTPGGDCSVAQRSFKSCTPAGCHGSEDAARSAFTTAKTRIANLVTETRALLAQLPDSVLNASDGRFTTAEGAKFNADLADFPGSPIHNPFLVEQLLIASINAVKNEYHLSSPTSVSLDRMLRK